MLSNNAEPRCADADSGAGVGGADNLMKLEVDDAAPTSAGGASGPGDGVEYAARNRRPLVIFAGEAYNVEQGVANEVFENERSAVPGCVFNPIPEDPITTNEGASDVINFANFMRLSAPPTPAALSASAQRGSALFDSVGCVHCHTRNLTTAAKTQITAFANVTYHPFSDFAVHHMGSTLADGTNQGVAQPDEFRTAPLWGLGQRLFFMHDGRARELGAAIAAHVGPGNTCVTTQDYQQFNANGVWFQPFVQTQTCAGEANQVIATVRRAERDAAAGPPELPALAVTLLVGTRIAEGRSLRPSANLVCGPPAASVTVTLARLGGRLAPPLLGSFGSSGT